ncbi:hypothetical protein BS47DRAFT_1490572 [Hydnum rufescens UP504]|uniref:Uncharacterized protein n=1 Tax=Hydnum rufescens UP504 TaxID=1448309 RepID=A0A9P6AAW0_9AGAM|nr:hypothetical protein BS47DRAFT_1490572 [Hydnum rufescens UP504]
MSSAPITTLRLRAFGITPQDRNFVVVIYTSDSDKIMRYTDEGETSEVCRWTVDLGLLPGFQRYANNPPPGGFYTISIVLDPGAKNDISRLL